MVMVEIDNDFEVESKYHHKTVVLLLTAHILSLQDVVFRSMFFLIFFKLSAGKGCRFNVFLFYQILD